MVHLTTTVRIIFFALFMFLLAKGKAMLWLGIFVASLFAAVIFGRIYCGYVCPMNTLMVPIEWLSKKLKLQTKNSPKWLKNGYFSWIMLITSVFLMIFSRKVLYLNLPLLPIWLGVAVIVTLRFKPSVFHNLICPFGAVQRAFGRFAWFSKKVVPSKCIGCKLCEKVCPSQAINVNDSKKAFITTALCHQCTNCQMVCPKDAICYVYKDKEFSDETPMDICSNS